MVLWRCFAALVVVVSIAAAAAGCSSGLSQTQSDVNCNQEQLSKADCFDAKVYALCTSCFMRCGSDCTPEATCPATYLCPGDAPIDGGSL